MCRFVKRIQHYTVLSISICGFYVIEYASFALWSNVYLLHFDCWSICDFRSYASEEKETTHPPFFSCRLLRRFPIPCVSIACCRHTSSDTYSRTHSTDDCHTSHIQFKYDVFSSFLAFSSIVFCCSPFSFFLWFQFKSKSYVFAEIEMCMMPSNFRCVCSIVIVFVELHFSCSRFSLFP